MRQLYDFKTATRNDPLAAQMTDLAAYIVSLP